VGRIINPNDDPSVAREVLDEIRREAGQNIREERARTAQPMVTFLDVPRTPQHPDGLAAFPHAVVAGFVDTAQAQFIEAIKIGIADAVARSFAEAMAPVVKRLDNLHSRIVRLQRKAGMRDVKDPLEDEGTPPADD
jgi:hypothetical protein